jgi:hypothetical protein
MEMEMEMEMEMDMHRTVKTWSEFQGHWDGLLNFLMEGECAQFAYEFPALERIVDELRKDEMSDVRPGVKGTKLSKESVKEGFAALSIEEAMRSSFGLAHYRLSRFDAPGKCLEGFGERVLEPWKAALLAHGFTFERCYPIVFISGAGCATNYHMDFSHVLAWQVYGVKNFCGLKDPDKWMPREGRLNYKPTELEMPGDLKEEDALCYRMGPGAVLWNQLLTPHWVDAGEGVAMSINLSHGGLRYEGKLCRNEADLVAYREREPGKAPEKVSGVY